jgi:hypothetical protein
MLPANVLDGGEEQHAVVAFNRADLVNAACNARIGSHVQEDIDGSGKRRKPGGLALRKLRRFESS